MMAGDYWHGRAEEGDGGGKGGAKQAQLQPDLEGDGGRHERPESRVENDGRWVLAEMKQTGDGRGNRCNCRMIWREMENVICSGPSLGVKFYGRLELA